MHVEARGVSGRNHDIEDTRVVVLVDEPVCRGSSSMRTVGVAAATGTLGGERELPWHAPISRRNAVSPMRCGKREGASLIVSETPELPA